MPKDEATPSSTRRTFGASKKESGEKNASKHAELIAAGFTPPTRGTGKPLKRPSGTKSTIAASMLENNTDGASEGSESEKPVAQKKAASKTVNNIDSKDANESVTSKPVAEKKATPLKPEAAATSARKVSLRRDNPQKSVLEDVGDEELAVSSAMSCLHLESSFESNAAT